MSIQDSAPEVQGYAEMSRKEILSISFVPRPGGAAIASLPSNDIRAIWRNEVGPANYTHPDGAT